MLQGPGQSDPERQYRKKHYSSLILDFLEFGTVIYKVPHHVTEQLTDFG